MRIHLVFVAIAFAISAPAAADEPTPPPRAHVLHVPPGAARAGAPIRLVAEIDTPGAEPALVVRWRPIGGAAWTDAPFERSSAGGWYATLPAAQPPGVEYYIASEEGAHFASAAAPQPIPVEPALYDRLAEMERARIDARVDTVALDVDGHDFGNRYGLDDYYARAELTWSHRFLRFLDATSFGMGAITGRTPELGGATALDDARAARYGFAGLRLRLDPSVFLDARAIVGVDQNGFMRGLGGALTFGKPWRSNVSLGGEVLEDLGASAWVRLQWDTAPPLLMGASIVRTDLPGALVTASGLFVKYDVSYAITDRLTLRAALSYGARDGAAHVGGALGTQVAF